MHAARAAGPLVARDDLGFFILANCSFNAKLLHPQLVH